jgi:hypothetical protein
MNNIAAVNLKTCHKLENTKSPFMLVLNKGDDFVDSLLECAKIVKLPSASLTGIGALANITFGYYDLQSKKYVKQTIDGVCELISLSGSVTLHDNKYCTHLHVSLIKLNDPSFSVIGGHLFSAKVGILAEINVIPFHAPIIREYSPEFNGNLVKT